MATVVDTLVTKYVLDSHDYVSGAQNVEASTLSLTKSLTSVATGISFTGLLSSIVAAAVGIRSMRVAMGEMATDVGQKGKKAFDTLAYQAERAGVSMGDSILKHVIPVVDKLSAAFQDWTDTGKFKTLGNVIGGVFNAIRAAIEPVLVLMGAMFGVKMLSMIKLIIEAYKGWRAATQGMAVAQALLVALTPGGVAKVLAAVAGAAAVAYGLSKTNQYFDSLATPTARPEDRSKEDKKWIDRPAPNSANFPEWIKKGMSYADFIKSGGIDPAKVQAIQGDQVRLLRSIEENTAPIREMMSFIFGGGELGRAGVGVSSMRGSRSHTSVHRQIAAMTSMGLLRRA